jgi:hypothetical protein
VQLVHIKKGLSAARRGDFATDAEVKAFFDKYGAFMKLRWTRFALEDLRHLQ